jgi:hypothetical protein
MFAISPFSEAGFFNNSLRFAFCYFSAEQKTGLLPTRPKILPWLLA